MNVEEKQYFYRIEKITHRPAAEDLITIIKEVKEDDLQLSRILATKCFLEEMQDLSGKYSPSDFDSYDTRKGLGFNIQLLLVNSEDQEAIMVESTMEKFEAAILNQKEEEKEIFSRLGLDYESHAF